LLDNLFITSIHGPPQAFYFLFFAFFYATAGFIPAIIAREILIRKEIVKRGKWLSFIVVSICLAISAFYELIEWWVAELTGESAEAFLGTQGYVWDTQA
jgi:putative membrane protein